jgi:hypothetical protein
MLSWRSAWNSVRSGARSAWNSTRRFVNRYQAEIVGGVAGVVVTAGCLAATAGAGSIGCMAAGGAAASAATNLWRTRVQRTEAFSWGNLARDTAIGGAVGAVGGVLGRVASAVAPAASRVAAAAASRVSSAAANAGSRVASTVSNAASRVATGASQRLSGAAASDAANTATLSGRTVLGSGWDDAIRAARNAKPEAGYFDVVAHGTPNAVFDAAGSAMSPSQLASVVRGTPSWAGQDVRLLSCSTGCPTGSFAQSLANELGVGVKAPTTDFFVNSRGGVVFDRGGSWSLFSPGG